MTLPIHLPPVLERYECRGCGDCCYGTIISLDADDLERIRAQRWDQHPEYRGRKIFVRSSLFPKRYQLAKRPDGACIFLTPGNHCHIHELHGSRSEAADLSDCTAATGTPRATTPT